MIRLTDLRLPIDHDEEALRRAIADILGLPPDKVGPHRLIRRGLDARKKHRPVFVYTLDVEAPDEAALLAAPDAARRKLAPAPDMEYRLPRRFDQAPQPRPVVIGAGPCGLFAALLLAQMGAAPLLLERGRPAAERQRDVERFWKDGSLDPESNVGFGEGGAGTFSDGKLTTQIKDRHRRCRKVLEELVRHGAPEEILYLARPHIGTDRLVGLVGALRAEIERLGGTVRFGARVVGLRIEDGALRGLTLAGGEQIDTERVILAIGHSARDTYAMLEGHGVPLQAKPFAIGLRIEHTQDFVNQARHRQLAGHPRLGAADYKLAARGPAAPAYSFCMCPGGEVIAASTEANGIVTNGMSSYARELPNANAALVAGIGPEVFAPGEAGPLAGIDFQRRWEQRAFQVGGSNYHAPVQRLDDFLADRPSRELGDIAPSYRPGVQLAELRDCLPSALVARLKTAVAEFEQQMPGFARPDALLTGVETRSSSPLRILRNEHLQSPGLAGLYPAGEGAGYAGGIMSSAVDGIKAAEALAQSLA